MSDAGGGSDFTNAADGPEPQVPTALAAGFSNVGTRDEQDGAFNVETTWGNAGVGTWTPDDGLLTEEWGNAGLGRFSPPSMPLIPPPGQAGLRLNTNIGINVFFTVTIDTVDLGAWSKCTGLGMKIETEGRTEAGMNLFQHQLPKHLTYAHITLERPLTRDSQSVLNWFVAYHMLPIPTSGQITCFDQSGSPIMSWELHGVSPYEWKGPSLDATAGSANVANEQLTIAHTGFF